MMRVPATEAIVIIIVATETMLWMLAAEAIVVIMVVAATIAWMLATEALLLLVAAKAMPPMVRAETTQAGRLLA